MSPLRKLSIRVSHHGEVTVLALAGELDVATAPQITTRTNALIDGGRYRLIIDLERLVFCDSAGLGALIGATRRLRDHGQRLHLAAPNAPVARLLNLTGLELAFTIHATFADALDALASSD